MRETGQEDPSSERPVAARWSRLQRQLHWWVAGVVACQFLLQGAMRSAMEVIGRNETISFGQFIVTTVHVWGGMLVLALTLYRLRLRRIRPVAVGSGLLSSAMAQCVQWTHRLLLVLVLLMGVSGVAHWYLDMEAAGRLHENAKWALGGLIAVHMMGALHHRVFRKAG